MRTNHFKLWPKGTSETYNQLKRRRSALGSTKISAAINLVLAAAVKNINNVVWIKLIDFET